MNNFLPISREDMLARGWNQLDFLFISGDAYVDHPSFGPAIICRVLESRGYKVGIIPQPDWRSTRDFKILGQPRLGVLISAGNMDSLLNKFTAAKKYRRADKYSPGGQAGRRPERATIVYANRIREIWRDMPIIIGGIEASLRRFAHYDYWSDKVRRSILVDSRADLLIFGMGERPVVDVARQLAAGIGVKDIRNIPGTCYRVDTLDELWDYVVIPGYEQVKASKAAFAEAFKYYYDQQDPINGKKIVQPHGDFFVVQNKPAFPLATREMDEVYELPYCRTYHPVYERQGGVPAIEEVKFSLVSHRGCFGGCSFCAIFAHQGRIIQSRSRESLLREADILIRQTDFKGYIHDVGGPTANFHQPACEQQLTRGACRRRQCLYPAPCKNLNTNHSQYLAVLRSLRTLPGVKKVFIRSGLRYDFLMAAHDEEFLREICEHHVSGQLKVAPEHIADKVINLMGKADKNVYENFSAAFYRVNRQLGKDQYLVPYFMSSHPGSSLQEAIELAEFIRDQNIRPEQVQDFIPTPGSLSTCMYYTGINPLTGKKVYVAKSARAKRMQRALLQYRDPKNYHLVYEALIKAGRPDLIGYGPQCLIKPRQRPAVNQDLPFRPAKTKKRSVSNPKTDRQRTRS